jgi:hypothetical protein
MRQQRVLGIAERREERNACTILRTALPMPMCDCTPGGAGALVKKMVGRPLERWSMHDLPLRFKGRILPIDAQVADCMGGLSYGPPEFDSLAFQVR